LRIYLTKPALPCTVTMTRVAPSNGLDSDNLSGSMKAIRDAVAEWLGVDDRDARIEWKCAQRRGPWSVELEIANV
jgi:hypothetical protein